MSDYYHAPAFILTALLLPAFGYLYLRSRNTRTLLWFLGFVFALLFMVLIYPNGGAGFFAGTHPWLQVAGQTCIQISVAVFLGSLSPLHFRIGRFRVLFRYPLHSSHRGLFRLPLRRLRRSHSSRAGVPAFSASGGLVLQRGSLLGNHEGLRSGMDRSFVQRHSGLCRGLYMFSSRGGAGPLLY